MPAVTKRPATLDIALLTALFAAEGAVAVIALALYKKGERPLLQFVRAPAGLVLVAALVVAAVSIVFVVSRFRRSRETPAVFVATLLLNLLWVGLALGTAEISIRALTVSTPAGESFAGTVLLPKSWDNLARRNRDVLARAAKTGSYLVFDERLGWSIAPGRGSKDPYRTLRPKALQIGPGGESDIYLSSAEGLRSRVIGDSLAARRPAHRIALVGDSFTFGLEVNYEDTWGDRLERSLGADTQVLNFGVDGYGVDQSVLRYQRDVPAWHPDIAILSFILDDLRRTQCVYAFLCFQAFGEIPFPKPRFAPAAGGIRQVNAPLPLPESVFAKPTIASLPFVDYDITYNPREWRRHFYDRSYLVRFVRSRFPLWPADRPEIDPEAGNQVNATFLREFIHLAEEQGVFPIVVGFPSKSDFSAAATGDRGPLARIVGGYGVPFVDMTACVTRVPADQRFVFLHYSPAVNAAVANCLADSVRHLERSIGAHRRRD
ncbi:MAG: SGNH/GDSL hydrolase family protein [bacterium]